MVDGDDWLYDSNVLSYLRKIYTENDIYLTWGQFETFPKGCIQMRYAEPIPKVVIEQKLYRDIPFVFYQLRTFKFRLFKEINKKDLEDPITKEYFRVASDLALFYPMLEMAGEKIKFINQILYVYNIDNPLNDFKINLKEQKNNSELIRHLPRYNPLNFS